VPKTKANLLRHANMLGHRDELDMGNGVSQSRPTATAAAGSLPFERVTGG